MLHPQGCAMIGRNSENSKVLRTRMRPHRRATVAGANQVRNATKRGQDEDPQAAKKRSSESSVSEQTGDRNNKQRVGQAPPREDGGKTDAEQPTICRVVQ